MDCEKVTAEAQRSCPEDMLLDIPELCEFATALAGGAQAPVQLTEFRDETRCLKVRREIRGGDLWRFSEAGDRDLHLASLGRPVCDRGMQQQNCGYGR